MTDMTSNRTGGSFNIGELLGSSFRILHTAFPRFIALALVPALPLLLSLLVLGPMADTTDFNSSLFFGGFVVAILVFVLYLAMQGAITYGAFCEMRNRGFTIGEAFSKGLSRALPLLGVAILASVLIMLGFVAFIVPGLILSCMLYVVIPVCVVEGRGVFESMGRSGELTRGYRWQILGLFLIVMIGSWLGSELVVALLKAFGGDVVGGLGDIAVQIYAIAFGGVLSALAYYRLRSIKEGIDIDRIADVFD
ncbi:hypothetical protein LMIY3S_01643 [Labrys miyagiensis]